MIRKESISPWTLLCAEEQGGGYGRKGNEWFSPGGGLYFSIILPRGKIDDLQTMTILAAFAVAKVIKEDFLLEPMIKIPNDVYVNNKKICGILTENIIGKDVLSSVMGIGLNTNIELFPKGLKATSLQIELGNKVDNNKILKRIVSELKKQLEIICK